MENLNFQDFCMTELLAMPRSYYQNFSADELLRMHLDRYETYLQARSTEASILQDFRDRREQLTRAAPGSVESRHPTAHRGVVQGTMSHFTSFIEACRRDGQTLGMNEPDFDEAAFYVWASGLDSVPQWMQTSFDRSVECHAEEIRREMYGQPRRLSNLAPGLPLYAETVFLVPHPAVIRSQLYQLLNESENYQWQFGNPVPGLLRPILPNLIQYVARGTLPFERIAFFWVGRVRMAGDLMEEAVEMGLREPLPNQPINFDSEPWREPLVEHLIEQHRLRTQVDDPESIGGYSSEWTVLEIIEPDEDCDNEISDILDGDTLDGYGHWVPPPYADIEPSEQELRDHLWDVAAQENIPEVLRAVLIDLVDQSDSEDEDSHVRVRGDWFDRGNILEDRRPIQLGPARDPWDSDSDDEMDDGLNWILIHFDQDSESDMQD